MIKHETKIIRVNSDFAKYLTARAERKQMTLVDLTRWLVRRVKGGKAAWNA